jgi:hypothetical protein
MSVALISRPRYRNTGMIAVTMRRSMHSSFLERKRKNIAGDIFLDARLTSAH